MRWVIDPVHLEIDYVSIPPSIRRVKKIDTTPLELPTYLTWVETEDRWWDGEELAIMIMEFDHDDIPRALAEMHREHAAVAAQLGRSIEQMPPRHVNYRD